VDRIECKWCKAQNEVSRTSCANCGGHLDVKDVVSGSDSALAALASSGADVAMALDQFAAQAQSAWPSLVEIDRQGLFGRGGVRKLVVRLPGKAFIARREGPGVVCEIGTLIRGAIVRTDTVPIGEWSRALQRELDSTLDASADARRFLGPDAQ
jgi:hypothetical protein